MLKVEAYSSSQKNRPIFSYLKRMAAVTVGNGSQDLSLLDYRLTLDQKAALHAVALSQLKGDGYRVQLALLLEVVFADAPQAVRQEINRTYKMHKVNPQRLAWLVALSGDQALFESLPLETGGEATVFLSRGRQVPIRWRLGMEGLMQAFVALATHPAFEEALDFLYPRYYDGPLYFLLPALREMGSYGWLAKAAHDASVNRELLMHAYEGEDGDELVGEDKEAIIADTISDAVYYLDLEALDVLLPLVPGSDAVTYTMSGRNGKNYDLVELLLKHHPESIPAILKRLGPGEQPQLELVLSRLGTQHADDLMVLRAAFYGLLRQNLPYQALEMARRLGDRVAILKGVSSWPPSVQQLQAFRELARQQDRADLADLVS